MKSRIDEFVLGSMMPDERAAMEQARRHDPGLDRGIKDVEDSMAALSLAAGELAPPRGLWKRVRDAIDVEREALEDRMILPLGEGDWRSVAPGIDYKTMWNGRTIMLRCAPGAVLPYHMHDNDEHLLVLSGDLIIGGRAFTGGDYIGSQKGFDRFPHSTRTGCLLLSQTRE